MSDEACACLRVRQETVRHEGGTCSDRWVCQDCGSKFIRAAWADYVTSDALKRARREALEEAAKECDRIATDFRLGRSPLTSSGLAGMVEAKAVEVAHACSKTLRALATDKAQGGGPCVIDKCGNTAVAHGYCSHHLSLATADKAQGEGE
jgi:hypothetical protein